MFGGAVGQVIGHPRDGQYIEVTDHRGNLIGKGLYNANSMYRVRLLWHTRDRAVAAGSVASLGM